MLDRDTGYAPQASDGYTSNYPSSTEELEDNSSYHQRQWGTSTTVQSYLEGGNPYADRQPMGDLPQTELSDAVSQHHWGSAGGLHARDYGDPLTSTIWSEWLGQTPSVVEPSRQGARSDGERIQWRSPSTHAGAGELDPLDNDGGGEDLDEDEEVSGTYASNYIGSRELLAPPSSSHTFHPEGSDNVFSHGVLSREHGHEEALDPYTNQLLSRLGQPDRGLQLHIGTTMGNPSNLDPQHWPIPDYEVASAPQPLQAIGGQQQMEVPGFGPTYSFQYEVIEDTSVVPRQTDFESRSIIASHDRLGPGVGLQRSEVASQINSDTSSDPLPCPFDGCDVTFTGDYRRGNLGRHRRLKHDGQVVHYCCEDEECKKFFRRKDARLKHYRTNHPERAGGPALSRTSSSSRRSAPTDV